MSVPPPAARSAATIRADLRDVERDLRMIRDPWLRRTLGRRRRALRDELIAARQADARPP